MDCFLNGLIKNKLNQKGNIFLKLNEIDYYDKNKTGTLCHYPGCRNVAIGSHTYPKSFLKRIANGNKVFATDIKHVVGSIYEEGFSDLVKEANIRHSGVQPLFCSEHDTNLFKIIELQNFNGDLETYLCLFLYRLYIYDFQLESEVHEPKVKRKINNDKAYSKKITKEDEAKYLAEQALSSRLISYNASFPNSYALKKKFDDIFLKNESPRSTDFYEYFILEYYDLGFLPEFFASGTMFFTNDLIREKNPLQSVYAIIPDKNLNTAYFCVLIPNESRESMNQVINNLNTEYEKQYKGTFFKLVEFLILDATQNIIMTESLYNRLSRNNIELTKICASLILARLPILSIESEWFRKYAYCLLNKINLLSDI